VGPQRPKIEARWGAGFAATATSWHKELRVFLRRRMLGRSQEVDDLAQEVYLRILRMDEARDVRDPMSYVYGIATNVLRDFWRSQRRGAEISLDDVAPHCEQLVSTPTTNDDVTISQQLEQSLRQLPSTQAAIVMLVKCAGLSHREVAAQLSISEHMVHKHLTEAMARLRAMHWDK
jgi:RNA polymerase sigma factor (sigma-70 family)